MQELKCKTQENSPKKLLELEPDVKYYEDLAISCYECAQVDNEKKEYHFKKALWIYGKLCEQYPDIIRFRYSYESIRCKVEKCMQKYNYATMQFKLENYMANYMEESSVDSDSRIFIEKMCEIGKTLSEITKSVLYKVQYAIEKEENWFNNFSLITLPFQEAQIVDLNLMNLQKVSVEIYEQWRNTTYIMQHIIGYVHSCCGCSSYHLQFFDAIQDKILEKFKKNVQKTNEMLKNFENPEKIEREYIKEIQGVLMEYIQCMWEQMELCRNVCENFGERKISVIVDYDMTIIDVIPQL